MSKELIAEALLSLVVTGEAEISIQAEHAGLVAAEADAIFWKAVFRVRNSDALALAEMAGPENVSARRAITTNVDDPQRRFELAERMVTRWTERMLAAEAELGKERKPPAVKTYAVMFRQRSLGREREGLCGVYSTIEKAEEYIAAQRARGEVMPMSKTEYFILPCMIDGGAPAIMG